MSALPPRIILASASDRRKDLLRSCGIPFETVVSGADESVSPALAASGARAVVSELALRKAEAVRARLGGEPAGGGPRECWILAADTEVEVDGALLGKPASASEAREMLAKLSGISHRVHSGVALICGLGAPAESRSVTTRVTFAPLSPAEIEWYVSSGEWEGAAGAYRIQGRAALLIQSIEGSYSNVVGLPLEAVYGMLMGHRYDFGEHGSS